MKTQEERWYDLFGRTLSRRDFVRVGRDLSACMALGSLPLPQGGRRPRLIAPPFTFGVASGDPWDTSVVIWTRLDEGALVAAGTAAAPLEVGWEVAEDSSFQRIVRTGTAGATGELGHSLHVEVEGLSPAREYWYRFWAGGEASPVGRTLTAHPPDSPMDRFRFAFVSCQNYEHGYFTAFRHLTEDRPDLLVHLGDYIYERRFGADPVREAPGGEVFTLDEYRMRYTTYRNDPDLQAAHAVCPWVATNDDHEVENNYADAIAEDERVPPDQFLLRRAAAYQAYYEFMPFRRSSMPVGPDMQLYRRLRFGSLLSLHVLDTRQYRDDQPCGDGTKPLCAEAVAPSRHLLGTTQESWLMDGLREVGPRWNCLANQVMMARVERDSPDGPRYPLDQWAGYPVARDRMLRFLESTRPSNPVVITGDIHSNWVSDLKADFDRPGSAVVGAEFVGTSIASGGDGNDSSGSTTLDQNPHLKFYNARRGYVLNTITPARWTADYRTVEYVSRPGSPVETKASFVVEDGRPGSLAG